MSEEQQEIIKLDPSAGAVSKTDVMDLYHANRGLGTETVTPEDLETPTLKVTQSNSKHTLQGGARPSLGMFYKTDEQKEYKSVEVNFLIVKKSMAENFNRNGLIRQHIFYGFYMDTMDPFRMFLTGYNLDGSRKLLTEVKRIERTLGFPMCSLRVRLTSKMLSVSAGKDSNQMNDIYVMVPEILKDKDGIPMVEENLDRAQFLIQSAKGFVAQDNGEEVIGTPVDKDVINIEDIPFL